MVLSEIEYKQARHNYCLERLQGAKEYQQFIQYDLIHTLVKIYDPSKFSLSVYHQMFNSKESYSLELYSLEYDEDTYYAQRTLPAPFKLSAYLEVKKDLLTGFKQVKICEKWKMTQERENKPNA